MREIHERGIVLDICPTSNLRTRAVASREEHPLPLLVEYGIQCSISTDDPEMFDTDLSREYEFATSFGIPPRTFYEAGVAGALCGGEMKVRLDAIGRDYLWSGPNSRG